MRRQVPRREIVDAEAPPGEGHELRVVALGKRLCAMREIAQEPKHLVDASRHLRHQRDLRVARVAEQERRFAPQLEDAPYHRRVVPLRRGAQVRRTRRVGAMQRCAQRAVLGVAHHRLVARHPQRELPAVPALCRRRRPGFGEHIARDAGELGGVFDMERPRVGRIEQVVVELRGELGELLLDRLEARLPCLRKLGASQTEVAQLVGDRALPGAVERRERRRPGERAITAEEPGVLREIREERGDLRQIRMVRIAQRGRAHHRVQVLNRGPRAVQPVERVGKRLGDVVPARRARIGGDHVDRVARRRRREDRLPGSRARDVSRRGAAGPKSRAADWRVFVGHTHFGSMVRPSKSCGRGDRQALGSSIRRAVAERAIERRQVLRRPDVYPSTVEMLA
jgi:hypothetical protein